jgi:hypothetical protein
VIMGSISDKNVFPNVLTGHLVHVTLPDCLLLLNGT